LAWLGLAWLGKLDSPPFKTSRSRKTSCTGLLERKAITYHDGLERGTVRLYHYFGPLKKWDPDIVPSRRLIFQNEGSPSL